MVLKRRSIIRAPVREVNMGHREDWFPDNVPGEVPWAGNAIFVPREAGHLFGQGGSPGTSLGTSPLFPGLFPGPVSSESSLWELPGSSGQAASSVELRWRFKNCSRCTFLISGALFERSYREYCDAWANIFVISK
jgi:hypothetical protein